MKDADIRKAFSRVRASADAIADGNLSEPGERAAHNEILKAITELGEDFFINVGRIAKALERLADATEEAD